MRTRQSDPLRCLRRLRARARRSATPISRAAVLIWFAITSLGIPLAQASPEEAHVQSEAPLTVDPRATSTHAGESPPAGVPEDELCVLPELLAPPKPVGRCGCSLALRRAGQCCCAAAKGPAAKSCCAKRTTTGATRARAHNHAGDEDSPLDRFAHLTCPCGSGSNAWITVAAEPRILDGTVALAPGGAPVEHLVAITPRLPQVFLSPEAPPPRAADRSPASL